MRRFVCLSIAVMLLASLAGCAGGGGVTQQITRTVAATLQWPASLGTVSDQQFTLRPVRTGTGLVQSPMASGAVPGTLFLIDNVPDSGLMEIEVSGRTGSGLVARLRAIIGQAVGRSRARDEIPVTLTAATTIASEAVVTLLENNIPEASITPTVLSNLESAAGPISGSVDLTSDDSVSQAADTVLEQTQNGALPGHSQGSALGG